MKRWHIGAWTLAVSASLSLAFLSGCGGSPTTKSDSGGEKPATEKTGSEKPGGEKPVAGGKGMPSGKAVVKGKVTFEGDMPDTAAMNAALEAQIKDKAAADKDHCLAEKSGKDKEQQLWRINPTNKGLANVVVFLIPEQGSYFANSDSDEAVSSKKKDVELRQPYFAFEPHVAVLFPEYFDKDKKKKKTNAKLVVFNDSNKAPGTKSGITHNTKWPGGNETLPPGSEPKTITDLEVSTKGPMTFQCGIHPWMNAYIWVLNTPYFAITNENGEYEIKNAPEGKVRIVVWHEAAAGNFLNKDGSKGEEIELKDGENKKEFTAKK